MTITKPQAQMLAAQVCECRPFGAIQWEEAKVMDQVLKVRERSHGSVICAFIRCAMDRNVVREECLSSPGPHWGDTMLTTDWVPDIATSTERCWCGVSQASHDIRRGRDHPFASEAEARRRAADTSSDEGRALVAAARAEVARTTSGPTERRTLADMAEANPELHAKVEALRAANPGLEAPPMREPEPIPTPAPAPITPEAEEVSHA